MVLDKCFSAKYTSIRMCVPVFFLHYFYCTVLYSGMFDCVNVNAEVGAGATWAKFSRGIFTVTRRFKSSTHYGFPFQVKPWLLHLMEHERNLRKS